MQKNPTSLNSAKKSRRNGTKIQTSTTYSKIKRPAIIAGLTIALMCYIFSTMTQATNLTTYNIAFMRMYGSDSPDTSNPQWRNTSFTIIDENNIVTDGIVYSQTRQLVEYTFTQVYVESLEIDFDISVELYSTGELLSINQSGTPKIEIYTPYKSINISYSKLDNYHIHYHYSSAEVNRNIEKIDIFTNVSMISAKMYISNINIRINNEITLYIKSYDEKIDSLNNTIQGYQNKIDEFNSRYIENKNSVLGTIVMPNAGYTVIPSILSATVFAPFMAIIGYAILSFILYGRK